MPPTIYDVAKAAGVSKTTISRMLNDSSKIKPDTAERIRQVMQEIGFTPNSHARGINRKGTCTVGILLAYPDDGSIYTDPFYGRVFCGITTYLRQRSFAMLYIPWQQNDTSGYVHQLVQSGRIDGGIILGGMERRILQDLKETKLPLVQLDDSSDEVNIDMVLNDNVTAGRLVGRYLWSRGHRNIAFIHLQKEPQWVGSYRDRFLGLRSYIEEQGGVINPDWVVGLPSMGSTPDVGVRCMRKLLEQHLLPDAICAANDLIALGAISVCNEQGMRIPSDISITGFDNIEMSAQFTPPLTTVAMSMEEMGRVGAQRLLELLNGQENARITRIVLPVALVERQSVRNKAAV